MIYIFEKSIKKLQAGYHFTHKTAWNIRKDTARGINSMNVYTR